MRYRKHGRTGLEVSEVSFGCGGTGGVLTAGGPAEQERTVGAALDAGINLFDTSPVYHSEEALGRALERLKADPVVETKVMLTPDQIGTPADLAAAVRRSVEGSLTRMRRETLDVVHLHNRVGEQRQDMPEAAGGAVLTQDDILGEDGFVPTLEELRQEGKLRFIGFGAFGSVRTAHELLDSGRFDSVLVYHNLLNPSAGMPMPVSYRHKDYAAIVPKAEALGAGVVALRCLAAGALTSAEQPHALAKTHPPLDAVEYAADRVRARSFDWLVHDSQNLAQAALRFVLGTTGVTTALIGFSDPDQVTELCGEQDAGALTAAEWDELRAMYNCPWLL